jgi:hypothetical protein
MYAWANKGHPSRTMAVVGRSNPPPEFADFMR